MRNTSDRCCKAGDPSCDESGMKYSVFMYTMACIQKRIKFKGKCRITGRSTRLVSGNTDEC